MKRMTEAELTTAREAMSRPVVAGSLLAFIGRDLLAEIDALRQENAQLTAVVPLAVKDGMLKVGQELIDLAARVRELEQERTDCCMLLNVAGPLRHRIEVVLNERAEASARVRELEGLLGRVTPEQMGGYPDLFSPEGGWEQFQTDVDAVMSK